ncbi:hypothetical protein C8F04DRAFT_985006, partial [Mycena alexandri]
PAVTDVYAFAAQWWVWWVSINPAWRERVGDRLAKAGEGDWKSVAQTGPNGMLNVLICLRWWYDTLKNDASEIVKWKEAVDDVEWAMKGIL